MCTFWKPKGFRQRLAGMKVKSGVSTICWLECCITRERESLFRKKYDHNPCRLFKLFYILQWKKKHKEHQRIRKDDFDWFSNGQFHFFFYTDKIVWTFLCYDQGLHIYSWLTNKHACHATYTYHSRLKMAKIIGGSRIPNNMHYLVLGKHQIYKYSTYLEILWKKNRYSYSLSTHIFFLLK